MKNINKKELHFLFNEIKNGSQVSFDNLYKNYKCLVYGISYTISKNTDISNEVAQNVFVKIWKLPKDKLPSSYEASWLYTATKNETIDTLKKNFNYTDLDSIYHIPNECDEVNNIVDIESFNSLISPLNELDQQILSLKLLSNYTFKEIGDFLNIPTATIQWRYYKSLKYLKPLLANLAMFILTFTAYKMAISSQKNRNDSSYESLSPSKSPTTYDSSISLNPEVSIAESPSHHNSYAFPLLCLSSAFLVFAIIFTIFLKIFQQKLKKKSSKYYMKK